MVRKRKRTRKIKTVLVAAELFIALTCEQFTPRSEIQSRLLPSALSDVCPSEISDGSQETCHVQVSRPNQKAYIVSQTAEDLRSLSVLCTLTTVYIYCNYGRPA